MTADFRSRAKALHPHSRRQQNERLHRQFTSMTEKAKGKSQAAPRVGCVRTIGSRDLRAEPRKRAC